ncbi:HTH transcriptional regulator, MarR family [Modestobacter italicus]|uniref:HTH transcriptional regulator, MarR family n=1 Tax=Modestobacter italicus (strain DSM 44449 / CECT 9708 / BC 501) TaxID=2732864 RepID=I4EYG1_MODI5|nr:MarR family transcriptional regulator [Modestobacter marinus]CCH88424.1 HTH transcriptional regulator, MarR family [Modestobacter marinus]
MSQPSSPADGTVPVDAPEDDDMVRLGIVLSALSRSLDRHMDLEYPHPRPPETHLAVLRLVRAQDGMTVRQVADALRMHSSNASAIVSALAAGGLLRREPDAGDRRVVHLHLTAEARTRVDGANAQVGRYLSAALATLDEESAAAVTRAVPGLVALRRAIS